MFDQIKEEILLMGRLKEQCPWVGEEGVQKERIGPRSEQVHFIHCKKRID